MRRKIKLLTVAIESAAVYTATLFAVAYGLATVVAYHGVETHGENGFGIGATAVLSAAIAAYYWFTTRWEGNTAGLDDIAASAKSEWDSLDKRQEKIGFAAAEREVDDGLMDRELWSEALVKADGDEMKRKAAYIKMRAAMTRDD